MLRDAAAETYVRRLLTQNPWHRYAVLLQQTLVPSEAGPDNMQNVSITAVLCSHDLLFARQKLH